MLLSKQPSLCILYDICELCHTCPFLCGAFPHKVWVSLNRVRMSALQTELFQCKDMCSKLTSSAWQTHVQNKLSSS
jgi:hypothetical protein